MGNIFLTFNKRLDKSGKIEGVENLEGITDVGLRIEKKVKWHRKKIHVTKDIHYYQKKFWKVFFYGLGGIFLFFVFANFGLFGSMPSFDELENPDSNLATEIISSDGVVLVNFTKKTVLRLNMKIYQNI
jgi:hypothetical protein